MTGRVAPILIALVALASCARRRSMAVPAGDAGDHASLTMPSAPTSKASATPPQANGFTPLGICNRIVATGAATRCETTDGGVSSATFRLPKDGAGLVYVARDAAEFRRIMNGLHFGDGKSAISEETNVLVTWVGGDALADAQIRLAVAQL